MPHSTTLKKLNDEAWRLRTTKHAKADELAHQAFQLAEAYNNLHETLLARLTLASGANFRMELDVAEAHLQIVQDQLTENTPRQIIARHLHQRCYLHFQRGQFAKVIESGQAMMDLIGGKGLEDERAWVLQTMGIVYQRSGNSHQAMESYRKAESLVVKLGDKSQISNIKMSIGTSLAELGKKAEALEMLQEALTIRLALGGDFHAGMIIGNISKIYHQLGKYTKALLRWTEAIEYLKKAGGMPFWAQAMAGRADTLRALNCLSEAEEQLKLAIGEAKGLPAPIHINIHLSLSRVFADGGKWDESVSNLQMAEKLMDETTDHSQRVELHSGFYSAYKSIHDIGSALHHHEQMILHRERHLNEQSVSKLAEWEVHYRMERLCERDEKLIHKVAELQNAHKEISNEKEMLLAKLATYDTLIDEMLEFIPVKRRGRFTRLIRAARRINDKNNADQLIQLRISETHPLLTPTELRTCSMIVHGWSSKEIANRSGTSLKNIEKHRSAIRKKAAIPRSVSLQVYLSGFAKIT